MGHKNKLTAVFNDMTQCREGGIDAVWVMDFSFFYNVVIHSNQNEFVLQISILDEGKAGI